MTVHDTSLGYLLFISEYHKNVITLYRQILKTMNQMSPDATDT